MLRNFWKSFLYLFNHLKVFLLLLLHITGNEQFANTMTFHIYHQAVIP